MVRNKLTFNIGYLSDLSPFDILLTIDKLMVHTKELTTENMHDETDRAVPKDTGALRASIHAKIDESFYEGRRVEIKIGPPIFYGKYVDKMSTSQVQHAVDPEAVGNYSDHLVSEAKQRLSLNWDLSKKTIGAQ